MCPKICPVWFQVPDYLNHIDHIEHIDITPGAVAIRLPALARAYSHFLKCGSTFCSALGAVSSLSTSVGFWQRMALPL